MHLDTLCGKQRYTNEYDEEIAKKIGDAHEKNPTAHLSSPKTFENLSDADEVIDLLNNEIGINIGQELNVGSTRKQVAERTLQEFYDEGLYVVNKNSDNLWIIDKEKLDKTQYEYLSNHYKSLDNNGNPI